MVSDDVDEVIEKSHLAWGEFVKGNPDLPRSCSPIGRM